MADVCNRHRFNFRFSKGLLSLLEKFGDGTAALSPSWMTFHFRRQMPVNELKEKGNFGVFNIWAILFEPLQKFGKLLFNGNRRILDKLVKEV